MEFRVLGPLEVLASGEALSLGSVRQRALLAVLLVNAGEPVSIDRVIDELWGERPPATAQHAVHVYVSGLRKLLRAVGDDAQLRGSAAGYRLDVDPERIDERCFERLIWKGQHLAEADPARARELFREALALWRGPPLTEFAEYEFAAREADRLEDLRTTALEGSVEPGLACGEHAQALGTLTSLIAANPLREQPRRLLMLALYRSGRHAEALAIYRDACASLDEIGLEPGPELRALEEAILRHDESLRAPSMEDLPASHPGGAALGEPASPSRLPTALGVPAPGPDGTIALLFTDIEGSTRLARRSGPSWKDVLDEHDAVLKEAITAEGGFIAGSEGDGFFATFADATAAVRAAMAILRELRSHPWPPEVGELRVRMGLHVGYVERTATGYAGLEVHRAARIAAAAYGGQLLLTAATRELVGDAVTVESLGFHRLKDFPGAVQLFCAVVDGRGASAFPPPRTEEVRPTNLPAVPRLLVGRERDVARVRNALALDDERVVTLIGRGGVGKTSLAIAVAAQLLDECPGGVWLVDLANVVAPRDVLVAVASAVGASADIESSPRQAIIIRLHARGRTLLILDNMEHLVLAAPAIGELVDALPDLRVLATSQAPLRIAAELCVALDTLEDDAALTLIERVARRRAAPFFAKDEDRGHLLEVVHLVDGLPLALELAAARLGVLSPGQLRDRLRGSPGLLEDNSPDRTERHRSLRASVDWSVSLLDAAARALFTRLGAFIGPAELGEIEAVAGRDGLDVLEALTILVDVALVRRGQSGDGRVRFVLPEALRQIASTLLDVMPGGQFWRRTHAMRQREIAWAARTILVSTPVYDAAVRADAEIAAAIRWARAGKVRRSMAPVAFAHRCRRDASRSFLP
ncbi:MAG: BTAD domain-containing putative transcriptional regulator [Solirubrobacteraceae bacterium]